MLRLAHTKHRQIQSLIRNYAVRIKLNNTKGFSIRNTGQASCLAQCRMGENGSKGDLN
jgi:hypothetical protein